MADRIEQLEKEIADLDAEMNTPQPSSADVSTSPETAGPEDPPAADIAAGEDAAATQPAPEQGTAGEDRQQEEMVPLSRYKNAEKRMNEKSMEAADLRRQNAQLLAELEQLRAVAASPKNPEPELEEDPDLAQFQEFYPEIAKPIRALMAKIESKVERANQRLSKLDETEQQAAVRAHWEAITSAHPDAREIAATPEFQSWAEAQPPMVRQAILNGSPEDVNQVLDWYKAGRPTPGPSPTPDNQLAEARRAAGPTVGRTPATPTQQRFTREQIATMPIDEFEKHEAEIDRQWAAGNIA